MQSVYFSTRSNVSTSIASVTMPSPVASRASAQQLPAGVLHRVRGFQNLLATFHRTRTAAEHRLRAAHSNAVDINHRVLRPHLAADQFIRLRNANRLGHPLHRLELHRIHRLRIAGDADGRLLRAGHDVCAKSQAFDPFPHSIDIGLCRLRFHHD
jgi:hypothetical protein